MKKSNNIMLRQTMSVPTDQHALGAVLTSMHWGGVDQHALGAVLTSMHWGGVDQHALGAVLTSMPACIGGSVDQHALGRC